MLDAAPVWLIDLTASLRVLLTLRTTTWYLHLVRAVVDAAGDRDPIPRTMSAYELRGTPTLILIDRKGFLRYHAFGQAPDLAVGAAIAQLLAEAVA